MTDRRKIYFHIGAHKTASSFLATNLRVNSEALAAQGVDLVFRQNSISTPFAKEVYDVSQGRRTAGAPSPGAVKSLRRLVGRSENDVLIANEDLVCHLRINDFYQNVGATMRHIRAACEGFDAHVILFVRKQSDYLESVYMQTVHLGRSVKFTRFLKRSGEVDLSWLRVVDDIAAAVGDDHVVVRPFETIRTLGEDGFLRQFLRLCGVHDPESFSVASSHNRAANRSYSGLAMQIAQRAQPLIESKEDRKALRRFLQENFSTATHPRAELLDPEARAEIVARYAPSNRELFARYDLGADGGALGYY